MTKDEEIEMLQKELKRLTMELEETNAILDLREEQLKAIKVDEQAVSELYSLLSNKDVEMESVKQAMLKNERKANAAINFQEELLNDMDEVKAIEKQNENLHSQIAELQSDAENYELQLMRKDKLHAKAENEKIAKLEMDIEELQLENMRLKNKIQRLENPE